MNYSIYKITNNVNQKVYIGFTEDVERRWKQHRIDMKKGIRPLYQAFRKYGLENFTFEVIFNSSDKEKTLLMETHYIKEYDSTRKGYNLQEGGYSPTQENREINRKRMIENNPMKNPEIKKKNKGMFVKGQKPIITEERNEKIRQSKLGSNNPNYGNPDASKPLNQYVVCPNCGISMNKGNYNRWHIKKCEPSQ